jgi:polar amino acid transport system substrate-binding protein
MTSKSESDIGKLLAPSGKLRVGVFAGSPLSMVQVARTGETHGISFDLGRELAERLGIPFEHVTYGRVAEVLEGIKAREVDFTVSNATPVRARDVDFSQTLLSLELGYLVPANSPILSLGDIDKTGLRIGVTMGSTSERTLPALLPNALVVPVPSLKEAIHKLVMDHLDVFATNKPILFEMADAMPRARILDGRWGVEHIAIAIPKGRDVAHDYIRRFVDDVQQNGFLAWAMEQAALRGAIKADVRFAP